MPKKFLKTLFAAVIVLITLVLAACASAAETPASELAPQEIPGEVVYIPFPVEITLDGELSDWEGVPESQVVNEEAVNPAENGSFIFSIAADMEHFYITMQMPDQNIIAGQHEAEFWNEDFFEFFINASDDLNATTYDEKIFQININAADIGNTDPDALTITGVLSEGQDVRGFVFKTEDGWGFEAAIPLEALVEPAHEVEIGFQAQINGASVADRDTKLIWSNIDVDDHSWENPSFFGRALFFEVGQTDIP